MTRLVMLSSAIFALSLGALVTRTAQSSTSDIGLLADPPRAQSTTDSPATREGGRFDVARIGGGGRVGGARMGGAHFGGARMGGPRAGNFNRANFNRAGVNRANVNRSAGRNVNRNAARNVNRNVNRTANRNVNRNINRTTTGAAIRPGHWVRPANYWWRPGGAVAAGAALGVVTAATAAAWAGPAPAAGYCWYYTDQSRTQGFWDACP